MRNRSEPRHLRFVYKKNVKVTGHDKVSEIAVNLEGGKTYFIKQSVYPGMLKGFTSLTMLDDSAGRKALQECKLGEKLGKNVSNQ